MEARTFDGCYYLLRDSVLKTMVRNRILVDPFFLGGAADAVTSERFLKSRQAHMILAPHFNLWCEELFDLPSSDDKKYLKIRKEWETQKEELTNRAISFFLNSSEIGIENLRIDDSLESSKSE